MLIHHNGLCKNEIPFLFIELHVANILLAIVCVVLLLLSADGQLSQNTSQ
jgi:hypothetical protein